MLKAGEAIWEQFVKDLDKAPGWLPLLVTVFLAIELSGLPEEIQILGRQVPLSAELVASVITFILYQLGDAIDERVYKEQRDGSTTTRARYKEAYQPQSCEAQTALKVSERGLYALANTIVMAAEKERDTLLVYFFNEAAKFLRSLIVPLSLLGLFFLLRIQLAIGILLLLLAAFGLWSYPWLKVEHTRRLYRAAAKIGSSEQWIPRDINGARLYFWKDKHVATRLLNPVDSGDECAVDPAGRRFPRGRNGGARAAAASRGKEVVMDVTFDSRRVGGLAGILTLPLAVVAVLLLEQIGGDIREGGFAWVTAAIALLLLLCLNALRAMYSPRGGRLLPVAVAITAIGLLGMAVLFGGIALAAFGINELSGIPGLAPLLAGVMAVIGLPLGLALLGIGTVGAPELPLALRSMPLFLAALIPLGMVAFGAADATAELLIARVWFLAFALGWAVLGLMLWRVTPPELA